MIDNYFKSALPVWIDGKEKEWNVTAELSLTVKKTENSTLTITGASFYQVFLNGDLLHFGPARKAMGYAGVDVLPLSVKTSGRLVIIVAGYYLKCYNGSLTPSFIQAEVEQNGEIIAATGRAGFDCRVYSARLQKVMRYSSQRQFSECYDFFKNASPADFSVVDPQVTLIPRNVDLPDLDLKIAKNMAIAPFTMQEELKHPLLHFQLDPTEARPNLFPFATLESAPFTEFLRMVPDYSSDCRRGSSGTVELWNFGRIETGFIHLDVNAETDCRIIAIFGEQVSDNGRPNPIPCETTNVIEWRLPKGKHYLYSFEPYTAMAVEVMITEGFAHIESVGIKELAFPERNIKRANIIDPELSLVYDAAIASFRHNAFDIYMDCPSRERAGWLCDSYFTSQTEFYLTGKTKVEDEFLNNYLLGGGKREGLGGMIEMCYPSTCVIHIPQWSLWYVLELYDYFTKRGRGDRKNDFKDQLYALLSYFARYENEMGLLEKLPGWNFVEWSALNSRVQDVSWPTNMLYCEVLRIMGELYGDESFTTKAVALREIIRSMAWNGKVFLDRAIRQADGTLKNTEELSETTQYYALRFGIVDIYEPMCAYLHNLVFNVFGTETMKEKCPEFEPSNAFPGFYIRSELMLKWEKYPELVEYIKHFFLPMAQKTGTLWEHKHNAASCDHGFASYIALVINICQEKMKGKNYGK